MKPPSLKFLLLRLLSRGPKSGYELMKEVERILGKGYPGSIYPILRWWEERGFVRKGEKYELTERGKKFLEEMEKRRKEYIEGIKRDLVALARALDDKELERLASFLPLRERLGDEAVFVLARLLERMVECGENYVKKVRDLVEGEC